MSPGNDPLGQCLFWSMILLICSLGCHTTFKMLSSTPSAVLGIHSSKASFIRVVVLPSILLYLQKYSLSADLSSSITYSDLLECQKYSFQGRRYTRAFLLIHSGLQSLSLFPLISLKRKRTKLDRFSVGLQYKDTYAALSPQVCYTYSISIRLSSESTLSVS